jgi:NAD(P)-dependent dehydrogenase (short-subunit alcohol dehydrogenase family)
MGKDRLKDKVAIVTGAGSIAPGWSNGRATAVLFAREGAKVLAADINPQSAEETAEIIRSEGGECTVCETDVTKSTAIARMVSTCLDAYGRIDIIPGGAAELSEEDWDFVYNVNLKSIFLTCKHVIPQMQKQKGGAIINVSSISSRRYLGINYISYPTTKAAINQFTRMTAVQYGPWGIRCNAILPGFIRTPMVEKTVISAMQKSTNPDVTVESYYAKREAQIPLRRMGDAWDVAKAALFLASDESLYVTGIELVVDGGVELILD